MHIHFTYCSLHLVICISFYVSSSLHLIIYSSFYSSHFYLLCISGSTPFVLHNLAFHCIHLIQWITFYTSRSFHLIVFKSSYSSHQMNLILWILLHASHSKYFILYISRCAFCSVLCILSTVETHWHRQTYGPTDRRILSHIELLSQLKIYTPAIKMHCIFCPYCNTNHTTFAWRLHCHPGSTHTVLQHYLEN